MLSSKYEKTRTTRFIDLLKNHKYVSIFIVIGIVIISISAFLKSSYEIIELVEKVSDKSDRNAEQVLFAGFDHIDIHHQPQISAQWGMAASIQSVLAYRGIFIEQIELVKHADGMISLHAYSGEYENLSLSLQKKPFPNTKEILKLIELNQPFLVSSENRTYVFKSLQYKLKDGKPLIDSMILLNAMDPMRRRMTINPNELRMPTMILVHAYKKSSPQRH